MGDTDATRVTATTPPRPVMVAVDLGLVTVQIACVCGDCRDCRRTLRHRAISRALAGQPSRRQRQVLPARWGRAR